MIKLFYIALFGLFFGTVNLWAQTTPDKIEYDFGDMYGHTDRFVDFYFKNKGEKKEYFLRLDKLPEITYVFSSSTLLPDSSIAIRFQVNPTKKGRFKYEIPTYFSDLQEPIIIRITGDVKELSNQNDLAAFQNCPDFSQNPGDGNPLDFSLTIVTVEKGSGIVLAKSEVALLQNGLVVGRWRTDKSGKIVRRVPLGYSYFYAEHEGYLPTELGAYINFRRNYVVLEMEKNPVVIEHPTEVEIIAEQHESTQEIIVDLNANSDVSQAVIEIKEEFEIDITESTILPSSLPVLNEIPMDNFSNELFKLNNIVFVLDVSTSMRAGDRFELMKYALYQLMEYIRPDDKIALVTYGSDARVVLSTTKGSDKYKMIEEVKKLNAAGFTAGGKGIKLGYNLAKKGFIEGGNNQIIVITDGAFNRDSDDYDRTVKRFTKEGYILSVAGIKNAPNDEEKMRAVAEQGNGRYVPIFKLADAQWNLIKEMREASFKGN